MPDVQRFPFVAGTNARGESTLRPQIPLRLIYRDQSLKVIGLLDSGADVNVLPYSLGLSPGAIWSEQTNAITLSGNMADYEARGLIIAAQVGQFVPVQLAFAWTQTDALPLIPGQVNFFMEFDLCFFRSIAALEVSPRANH